MPLLLPKNTSDRASTIAIPVHLYKEAKLGESFKIFQPRAQLIKTNTIVTRQDVKFLNTVAQLFKASLA